MAVTDGNRLLLVQERKPSAAGKWNLPGGHVELGESPIEAASRELLEEAGFVSEPQTLISIYSGPPAVCFVFLCIYSGQSFVPSLDIIDVKFFDFDVIRRWPDDRLVGPRMRRLILAEVEGSTRFSLEPFVVEAVPVA